MSLLLDKQLSGKCSPANLRMLRWFAFLKIFFRMVNGSFWNGRTPKGLRGCGFFNIKDGKIVFQRGYWDKLSFLKLHNIPLTD